MRRFREGLAAAAAALSCLGQGKSFATNPLLGSPLLNRLGLHAGRVVASDLVARWRWLLLGGLMPPELRARYHRDGFVVLEGFSSAGDVEAIYAELGKIVGPVREMIQGDTRTQRVLLDRTATRHTPALRRVVSDPRLLQWLAYCGAKWQRPRLYLQRIRRGDARRDPQTRLHSDTFHATMKAWLFLHDVAPADGPLEYVPGSHRLSRARLAWERAASMKASSLDRYSRRGSLRIDESELASLGLGQPVSLTARAGTLVIANTHGFHRRGKAGPGASRLELWAFSRPNPFNPLPGLGLMIGGVAEDVALHAYLNHLDSRALRHGARPTWEVVDRAQMFGDLSGLGRIGCAL